ncbi:MAG: hypothetical protein MJY93_03350 [Fibrobacter sp.]|nr:hypothetical protein [Fibrobacter sp.]
MTTKTHSERDFFDRATTMLKAYEALEDFSPLSKYTHEIFVNAWQEEIARHKEKSAPLKPIDFLQVPFRIAQFNDDDTVKEKYTTYIESAQERLGKNTNAGDHLNKYQNLFPETRPERIFDDGDLFPEDNDIAQEFNFAYRFAQYAQICIEQENEMLIDIFLGNSFDPNKSQLLPNELRSILNSTKISTSPKEFWEKWKEYFSPSYMNMKELDRFLMIFILSINKKKPEKIALKEILLKARLYNIICYPVDVINNPSEDLFFKLRVRKEFAENKKIDLENIKDKLNGITPEHNLSKKKEFLDQKWSIATLVNSFSNIIPIISQIKKFISFNNTNKDQLEINEKLLSGDPKFLILDKIELPIKKDNEPKWLFPLAQLFFQLKQNPQNLNLISFIIDLKEGRNAPIIEGEDPSEFVSEFLVLLALAEFLSKDTKQMKISGKEIEYPNSFNPNIVYFRLSLIMGQFFAHPKISKFLTNLDFAKIVPVDLFKNLGDTLKQIPNILNLNAETLQNVKNQFDIMGNQLIQTNPDNIKETTNRILSKMQDLQQQLMSQQEKNDLEVSN